MRRIQRLNDTRTLAFMDLALSLRLKSSRRLRNALIAGDAGSICSNFVHHLLQLHRHAAASCYPDHEVDANIKRQPCAPMPIRLFVTPSSIPATPSANRIDMQRAPAHDQAADQVVLRRLALYVFAGQPVTGAAIASHRLQRAPV